MSRFTDIRLTAATLAGMRSTPRLPIFATTLLVLGLITACSDDKALPAASTSPSTTSPPPPATATLSSAPAATTAPSPGGPQPTGPTETVQILTANLGTEFEAAPGGTSLSTPTFSQCNFEYDVERLRKARSLVVRGGSTGPVPTVSVEAVAYDFQDTATLAVTEVRTAVAGCTTGDTYTELPAADQTGLSEDRVAMSLQTATGATAHFIVQRRGVVVVVVIGTDIVSADATARTMNAYLASYTPAAVGL